MNPNPVRINKHKDGGTERNLTFGRQLGEVFLDSRGHKYQVQNDGSVVRIKWTPAP